ncbi:MAG: FxDxF family PEP-CTERM protein [Burkholderiaceae bacterium]
MKLNTFVKNAAVAAMLVGAAFSASATDTPLGAATVGVPLSFGGYAAAGTFLDNFLFSLPANCGSGYTVSNFSFLPGQFNTVFSGMSLVSSPDGVIGGGDDMLITSAAAPGGAASLSLPIDYSLAAGNYYLSVYGVTNGTQGGIYNGAISVSAVAAPVPEPESYAMLLAGLGVMGTIAMRRNKSKKQD